MSKLLINESPLMVIPSLAKKIGLNEAIILQQVHYWLNPSFNQNFIEGKYWVYNSYPQWLEQFPFWSVITVKRAIQSLEKSGLLIGKQLHKNRFNKAKWYTIDYGKLAEIENKSEPHTPNAKNGERARPYETLENNSDTLENITEKKGANPPHRSDQNGGHRWGQFDPIEKQVQNVTTKAIDNESIDGVKLIPSYTETTTETTHTHTPPNLTSKSNGVKPESVCVENDLNLELEKEMLEVWNKIVQKKSSPCSMTPWRSKKLLTCLEKHFSEDLEQWRKFCKHIAENSFLMGRGQQGWYINLDWILKLENLTKVLEGVYDASQSQTCKTPEISLEQIYAEIDQSKSAPLWNSVCKNLARTLGPPTFKSWIGQLVPKCLEGKSVEIQAPTRFIKNWVSQNFMQNIQHAFHNAGANVDIQIVHK